MPSVGWSPICAVVTQLFSISTYSRSVGFSTEKSFIAVTHQGQKVLLSLACSRHS